jgi:diguanylate cyclase (GGDEF)-like protein
MRTTEVVEVIAPGRETLERRCEQAWGLRVRATSQADQLARRVVQECRDSKQDEEIRRGLGLALGVVAECAWRTGRLAEAEACALEAWGLCGEVGSARGQVRASLALGVAAFKLGRVTEGRERVMDGLALAQEGGAEEADAWEVLGRMEARRGELERAQELHRDALGQRRGLADDDGVASSLSQLGALGVQAGRLVGALEALRGALLCVNGTRAGFGAAALEGEILRSLSDLYALVGDEQGAHALQLRSLELVAEAEDREGEVLTRVGLGLCAQRQGAQEEASAQLEQALAQSVACRIPSIEAEARAGLGLVLARGGEPERALRLLERAAYMFERLGDELGVARALAGQVELGLRAPEVFGETQAAGQAAVVGLGRRAIALAQRVGAPLLERALHQQLSTLCERAGEVADALEHHKRYHALEIAQREERERVDPRVLQQEVEVARLRAQLGAEQGRAAALEDALREQAARLEEAEARAQEQRQRVTLDGLTQVLNRRQLERLLGFELERARRHGRRLSVVLWDMDGMLAFNDRHGHQAGDELLRRVARVLELMARPEDGVGRWAGNVFMCILPATGLDAAQRWALRVSHAIRELRVPGADGEGSATASAGICGRGASVEELVEGASAACYEAKRAGRDRIVISS